jgi:hypothetical protein
VKLKSLKFPRDITNLSEVIIGNGIYVSEIEIWKQIDTSELLLKYLKIYNKPISNHTNSNNSYASQGKIVIQAKYLHITIEL